MEAKYVWYICELKEFENFKNEKEYLDGWFYQREWYEFCCVDVCSRKKRETAKQNSKEK